MGDTITIKFGPGNSLEQPASKFATVGDAIGNAGIKAVLGYDSNAVETHVNGQPSSLSAPLNEGDEISLHTKAHSKAA